MKIGYFITHFPYYDGIKREYKEGGAEYVAYNLAVYMGKKHIVTVFTTSADHNDHKEKIDNKIKINRYGTKFKIENGNFAPKLYYDPLGYNFDIIHAHFSTPSAELAALRVAKKKGLPLVLTYHGDWQENFGKLSRRVALYLYNRCILNTLLTYVDIIVVPSRYYIDESRFLKKYKYKATVIPNGIDISKFQIKKSKEECRRSLNLPEDRDIIMFLGNLIHYKSPDTLIKSIPHVLKEHKDVYFVIAGDGRLRSYLLDLTRKLDTTDYVKFTGFIEERIKPYYYKSVDIFCLPSIMNTEVFPIVLLEASASGLPMVVSDLKTFKCIVEEHYNGLIFKKGDYIDLSNKISYLLNNKKLLTKLSKNAVKKVLNYTWVKVVEKYERLYENLL